MLLPQYY